MAGKFKLMKFSDVSIKNSFFDSLKNDYLEFEDWFEKKKSNDEEAFVYNDEKGIGAFLYLKEESESIDLKDKTLPLINRIKIGTLRIDERIRGSRLGEGALGVSLWKWRDSKCEEIYVTVFPKHTELISLFIRFGFKNVGTNIRGELVFLRNKNEIDFSNAYTSFPFINPNFKKAGLIPINDDYHDQLFPYSELKAKMLEIQEETAGNGITKVFIATPINNLHYEVGEPVFIYRKHTGDGQKTYKSVVTSFCTIVKVMNVKTNGIEKVSLSDFIQYAGNKTVYSVEELIGIYSKKNIFLLELVYNGFFGKGKNVIYKRLKEEGLFEHYPYELIYSKEDFIKILEMGAINVENVIINQS